MNKKIIAILLIVLFLIDIIAAALLFINIQILEFPETSIRIDVVEINSDEIIIHHNLHLYNPNSFEMILQDFQIVAVTTAGEEVANLTVEGGAIPGQTQKNFSADDRIVMKGSLSGLLSSTITGVVGFNLFGVIKKTIPLEMTVLISLKEALKKIALPDITVRAEVGTITRHHVNLTTQIDVTNPNPISIDINEFILNITTETGANVGNFIIPGTQIPAERSVTLVGQGTVLVEALNAKILNIALHAEIGMHIAGLNKSLPFSTEIEIAVPDINQYVPQDKPLELSLGVDLQRTRGGLKGNMSLVVFNPTKIPLIATDIVVWYYVVKDDQKYFVAKGPLGTGELVPGDTTYFYGEIILTYSKLLKTPGGRLLPDEVFAELRTNVTLPGITYRIPVAIGTYIDFHPLRAS